MSDQTIPLHLPKLDASKTFPVCHRLTSQRMDRACVAKLYFVFRHMNQTLVEGRSHEYKGADHLACSTIVDPFVPPSRESSPAIIVMSDDYKYVIEKLHAFLSS